MLSRMKLCFLPRDVDLSVMYKIEFQIFPTGNKNVRCARSVAWTQSRLCFSLDVCTFANFQVCEKWKWAEEMSVQASALELSRILASSPSVQWSCSPWPFYNWQPRFYTSMQIQHINPFHLVGVGMKHCKKAKQTKGFSKANPLKHS
jgi:hypothetical protein